MIVGIAAKVISVLGGVAVIVASVGAVPSIGTVTRASVGVSAAAGAAGAAIAGIGIVVIAAACGVAVAGTAGAVIARTVGIAITGAAGITIARAVGVPIAAVTAIRFLAGNSGIVVMHDCPRHSRRRIPHFTYTAPLRFTARKIDILQRTGITTVVNPEQEAKADSPMLSAPCGISTPGSNRQF